MGAEKLLKVSVLLSLLEGSSMQVFPNFTAISLKDKQLVELLLQKEQPIISEMTFGNMYTWRKTELVEVASLENSLVFRGKRKNQVAFYSPPVGKDDKVSVTNILIEHSLAEGFPFLMKGIVEPLSSKLAKEGLTPMPERDNWDYVYLTEDLAKLSSPKYYSKRKEIKKFESKYKHEYVKITPSIIPQCIKLQEQWCFAKDCNDSPGLREENFTILDALQDFDKIGLSGGAVFVDGNLSAFTIGEMLNSQTWATHFEKASPDIRGLYQYINQKFARDLLPNYGFINREQDLGQNGLRAAKTSYRPHHMVEKSFLMMKES